MRKHGYAAAWLNFRSSNHMKRVKQGDIIFMFKVNIGIIAIQKARALANNSNRVIRTE